MSTDTATKCSSPTCPIPTLPTSKRSTVDAAAERQICDTKATGLTNLPSHSFAINTAWLQLTLVAHDLLAPERIDVPRRPHIIALRDTGDELPAQRFVSGQSSRSSVVLLSSGRMVVVSSA